MKNKILKVIQVIYDILSLGFIVFVIVAMAVTPKSVGHHENNVMLVERKARDNMSNGSYYLYGAGDILTSNFVLKTLPEPWINNPGSLSVNETSTLFGLNDTTRIVFYTDADNQTDFGYSTGSIINARYIVTSVTSSGLSNIKLRLEINSSLFSFKWDFYLIYSPVSATWRGGYCVTSAEYVVSSAHYFVCKTTYLRDIVEDNSSYQSGYQTGYGIGYDKGSSEAYNKAVIDITNPDSTTYQYIYDLGKQEGIVEGMRGTESNAFVVIGQAFSAVGSIFSIEVLPNLPLWVLVFTPLIIVVVIVVVKLIKG